MFIVLLNYSERLLSVIYRAAVVVPRKLRLLCVRILSSMNLFFIWILRKYIIYSKILMQIKKERLKN